MMFYNYVHGYKSANAPSDTIFTQKCKLVVCFTSGTNNKDGWKYLGAKCIWSEKIMKACVQAYKHPGLFETPEMPRN